jgi:hypothetical protein
MLSDLLVWVRSPWMMMPFVMIVAVVGVSLAVGQRDLPEKFARRVGKSLSTVARETVRRSISRMI